MAFGSREKLLERLEKEMIVYPFEEKNISHSAYELAVGYEAFITSQETTVKKTYQENEQICIPPGQFAILLTKENVKIPLDSIGFISIKATIKF
jgi:dCTP deaminase